MRLLLLVVVVLIAFAANSVLTRIGVAGYGMQPMTFAALRVAAGAVALLVLLRGRILGWRWAYGAGAVALAIYMAGFSIAYLSLGAGLGALILFGTVQLAMFAVAVGRGQGVGALQWVGMAVALAGLAVLLVPVGGVAVDPAGALAMMAAGLGWAVYTLLGRGAADATAATAAQFALCVPIMLLALPLSGGVGPLPPGGLALALVAGAVTSGLGYALWYRVLPELAVTTAAVAQLAVPVIAVIAGVALLGEPLTPRMAAAMALVLGGIAVAVVPVRYRRMGSSGS
ncbi:Threonine/homoserine efflux transporter RhtA [Loktanella fryxellensis]|uniref:Threonine/homoserine efflux transporter RhtA n=1 Tax=Loktanella fryxellensis TaxID=245187 RepID=A0A1H8D9K8_9RHOB|nr:DMT family transporter [Loktanella fryxellensis]SEN03973.1 Threonine/homoserine efflux transporter RhtA [Loktanella fryxellensis]